MEQCLKNSTLVTKSEFSKQTSSLWEQMPAKDQPPGVNVGEYDQNHPSEVFPMVRLVWRFEIQKTQKNLFFVSSQPKSSVFWTVCRDLKIWPFPKIKNIFS